MKRLIVGLVVVVLLSSCVHASIIEQEFTNKWTAELWERAGVIHAWHWQYQPFSTFDSSLGTLTQVTVTLDLSLTEATLEEDTFKFSVDFFTGWGGNWLFVYSESLSEISEEPIEIKREWVFSSPADLSRWTDPEYGPDGHHHFGSKTFDAPHTIEASTHLIYEYDPAPVPLPASGLIWLGLFGSMVVAGWWRRRKHA
jgi:hypothetical protein